MKISTGNDTVVIGKNGGIIRYGVNFGQQHGSDITDGIFSSTVYLRNATKRIGVLYMFFGSGNEFTTFKKSTKGFTGFYLPFMRTNLLDTVHERFYPAVKSLKRKGGYEIGSFRKPEGLKNSKHTVGAHKLGSVEQGKPFFTHQFHRFPAKFIEHTDSFTLLTFIINITNSDQWQKEIGQWRQITGCPQ